ncbi:MAG: LysM peptidoglycan-binding domain-containing protein [Nitrolancea sp.]
MSVDYQARFCLTDRHVQCRRFQRAVPEIPESEAASRVAWSFEPRTFMIAGIVAAVVLIAAAAFTFQGTWAGWFNDHSVKTETGQSASSPNLSPTPIVLGGGSSSPSASDTTPVPTTIPVLSSSPTADIAAQASQTATSVPTTEPTATAAATATPSPSPTPSPATPTPEPSQTPIPPTTQIAQAPTTHVVVSGETLSTISATYNVPTHLIALANDLNDADVIAAGTTLYIPDANGRLPDSAPVLGVHVVQSGESLSSIATSFGVTTQNLMYANGISDPNHIEVGQVLTIPRGNVAPPAPPPAAQTTYTVQAHDTLYSIAKRYGVTIEAIMAANGLTDRTYITTGQVLIIPN